MQFAVAYNVHGGAGIRVALQIRFLVNSAEMKGEHKGTIASD